MAKIKNKKQFSLMIAMLMLAVGLFVATKSVQNNQENRSQAASTGKSNKKCTDLKGTCILFTQTKNIGSFCKTTDNKAGVIKSHLCLSNNLPNYQCCVPNIDGKCATKYVNSNAACIQGIKNDKPNDLYIKTDGTTADINTGQRIEYRWSCGTNNKCVQKIKINGVCDTSKVNGCKSGISSTNPTDTATKVLWTCKGINGGTNVSCSKVKTPNTITTTSPTSSSSLNNTYNKIYKENDSQIINTLNKSLTGAMKGTGNYFVYYAKKANNDIAKGYDRDPYLAAAIAMHESWGGYDCNAIHRYNVGEIGSNSTNSYPNIGKGIKAIFSFMGSKPQSLTLYNKPSFSGYTDSQFVTIQRAYNTHINDSISIQWKNRVTEYYKKIRQGKSLGIYPPANGKCF